jgi:hypothetical protein
VKYLPLHDIPHLFLVFDDFGIVPCLQLVKVFYLSLQHTQRFSERLQIYAEYYERGTDIAELVSRLTAFFSVHVSHLCLTDNTTLLAESTFIR